MTNLDIETFWAVVQHGTMTAAAEALYITQPTLSMRIRALEERVGTPLFIRGKGQRRIRLTAAGQKFLTLARRWQRLLSETEALAELEQRTYLRIAATYTTNQYILPAVYQKFLAMHLPVSLWIHTLRDVDSAQALLNHELDFALIDSNTVFNSQLEVRPICRERFLLLSAPDSDYPAEVDPSALDPANEILVTWDPEFIRWHDSAFGPAVRRHFAGGGLLPPHGGAVGSGSRHRRRVAGPDAGPSQPPHPGAAGSGELSGDAAGRGAVGARAHLSGRSAEAPAGPRQCAGLFVKNRRKRVDIPCFLA